MLLPQPKRGQRGSRRWRKYRARNRELEERHRCRVAQATHEAARAVVVFAVEQRIAALADKAALAGIDVELVDERVSR